MFKFDTLLFYILHMQPVLGPCSKLLQNTIEKSVSVDKSSKFDITAEHTVASSSRGLTEQRFQLADRLKADQTIYKMKEKN